MDFKAKNAQVGFNRTKSSKILKNGKKNLKNRYNSLGVSFPH